eukprot:8742559-Lingulodinium_polyedra.AAC.1
MQLYSSTTCVFIATKHAQITRAAHAQWRRAAVGRGTTELFAGAAYAWTGYNCARALRAYTLN